MLTLYHGTSLDNAQRIKREGFTESAHGLLGPGVYLAEPSLARKYAMEAAQRGKGKGAAIVKVRVLPRQGETAHTPCNYISTTLSIA
jgi:hypothetical protein